MTPQSTDQSNSSSKKNSFFSVLVRRLPIHLLGLSVGALLEEVPLLAYIGIICLLPRGDFKKPTWYIPTIIGLLQALAAFFLGASIPTALFWGGLQRWVLSLFQNRGRLCWDYSVAPFLLLCLDTINYGKSFGLIYVVFISLFLVGVLANFLYNRIKADQIHEERFASDLAQLQELLKNKIKPEKVGQQARLLANLSEALSRLLKDMGREGFQIIDRIHSLVEALQKHVDAEKPSSASGWSKGLLKSQNWGRKGEDHSEELVKLLAEGNDYLKNEVKRLRKGQTGDTSDQEAKWIAFEESATDLQTKAVSLPDSLAKHVLSISNSSVEIVKNMREDPADRLPGERFLSRYLTAVHKIVDEYIRLAEGPVQKDVEHALSRSAELLQRMDDAFKDELASLLQNDAINLTAEVDAIDAMLRMKGH